MKKRILKNFFGATIFLVIILPVFSMALPVQAQVTIDNEFKNEISLADTDPRVVVARVINIFLSILGVIAVALILYAGFKWMTAAGNEDKVNEAKKMLISSVIGLLIILASYGIATFVLKAISNATS